MQPDNPISDLKAKKTLSIFLSYGHTDLDKVLKIKNGLAERGYKNLWIDLEGIKPGDVWRRDIQDGIRDSDVFIAFLSKYSMRDPGVCRDEVQISVGLKGGNIKTVLLEPLEEVLPPATIAHTQWLDLHEWNGTEEKLPTILDEICRMVESKDNYYFGDEVDQLLRIMNPANCDDRIKELNSRQMFGREWLYDALTEWDKSNKSNVFWISGGAGFGKSMFSANLCFKMSAKVVAAHFVEWNNTKKNEAGSILKSLAFQLARRYPDYRRFITALPGGEQRRLFIDKCDPDELCDRLFCEEAGRCIDGGHESAWVLIDALDEATQNGRNPVAGMIAQYRDRFPKWMKFVITSRDDAVVRTTLGSMNPNVYDLDQRISRYQKQDMRAFLTATLAECRFSEAVFDTLIEKSEGMFLYLRYACETILADRLKEWQIKDLPQGITGIYKQYFNRHFGNDNNYQEYKEMVRPILEIYCAAYEVLPLEFFAEVMKCGTEAVREAVARLGTLKTDRLDNGKESFQLCHKSVWDWLVNLPAGEHSYRVAREEGFRKLTDFCFNKTKEYKMEQIVKDPNYEYPLRYVIRHLTEEKNEPAIWELLGGEDPQLPKLQFDYFGSYAAAVSSLKTAILFYMGLYNGNAGKQGQGLILPKIARLMVTYVNLQSEQQKDLQKIFRQGNSLQETLDYMESLKDVKVYFVIGCYLLTKVKENHWNMDDLIAAIEKKCGNQIDSIGYDERGFLGLGALPKTINDMTAEQIIRLFKCIGDRRDAKNILNDLKYQLNRPQAARAYWYFDKLQDSESGRLGNHNKLPEEKERIDKIQDADDRCEELINLATNLYVHDNLPEAEKLLNEAVNLLKEADRGSRLEGAAELYWNMGKTDEAGRLILDNHAIYGNNEDDFINALCIFGLSEKAYGFFEKYILPDPQETADFLKKCVSPIIFLQGLAENGWPNKANELLLTEIKLEASDFIALLETMLRCERTNDAAELLQKFCAQEDNKDCLFKNPKLLVIMRQLKDAGAWTETIPDEKELKENYLKNNPLEKISDYGSVFSHDFSPEFQLELIQDGWQCFLDAIKKPELSAKDKDGIVDDMRGLLTDNFPELRGKLTPIVCSFLERIKELSKDKDFFTENRWNIERWLTGRDSLLNDTLDDEAINNFVSWCDGKVTETIKGNNYDSDILDYVKPLLHYYFAGGQLSKAEALLNNLPISDSDKVETAFDALGAILFYWTRRSERHKLPLPSIPESFAASVDLACKWCTPQHTKLGDVRRKTYRFFERLKPYREQSAAIRIGEHVWEILDSLFQKTAIDDLSNAPYILKEGVWCIPEEQFGRWLDKLKVYVNKNEGSWRSCRDDYSELLICRYVDSENLPEDWYANILDEIAKITDLSVKNRLWTKLLSAVIQKGTAEQQQEILARLTDRDLIGNTREFIELDLEKLYGVLTSGNASDAAIHSIVKDMSWEKLPFEKLCIITPHMLDEKAYVEKWFDLLFRKLLDDKDFRTMLRIVSECPELGLSCFCDKKPEVATAATLTAAQVAAMVPQMNDTASAILELRRQLAEEEITPKGYNKKLGELLAVLPDETKQKFAELERSLAEGDITEKGFAKQLSELL